MPNAHKFSEEQIAELVAAKKENRDKTIDRRLTAVLLRAQGVKTAEVVRKTDFVPKYVSELVCKYCKGGLSAIAENHYGGNRRNMSVEEETELLEPFLKRANAGQIVDTKEIEKAYRDKVGHEISSGQIYRVLQRQKWRKVMPRSKHPKAAKQEVIEIAKNKINFSRDENGKIF